MLRPSKFLKLHYPPSSISSNFFLWPLLTTKSDKFVLRPGLELNTIRLTSYYASVVVVGTELLIWDNGMFCSHFGSLTAMSFLQSRLRADREPRLWIGYTNREKYLFFLIQIGQTYWWHGRWRKSSNNERSIKSDDILHFQCSWVLLRSKAETQVWWTVSIYKSEGSHLNINLCIRKQIVVKEINTTLRGNWDIIQEKCIAGLLRSKA